jgi:sn-glycerol 3-phosphate transport system ATP-binding protein
VTEVRLTKIEKRYSKNAPLAVAGVDLTIASKEFFVLLGPSGCGKSTLLRLIAGLEEPTEGELYMDGELANYINPADRNVAMVFQNYALYPHMSVEQNIRFPLKMRRTPQAERSAAVLEAARVLGLDTSLLQRPVGELSGGQRQRVALARAIVRRPRVMLMDEPLSNLDAVLRSQTREELLKLHRAVPTTIVYVTHDQIEAMTMGDRIAVMNHGRVVQVGTPAEIYDEPVDRFVAGFVGSPPMNFIPGTIERSGNESRFVGAAFSAVLPAALRDKVGNPSAGARFDFGVRPERLMLVRPDTGTKGRWTVEVVEQLGAERIVRLQADGDVVRTRVGRDFEVGLSDTFELKVNEQDIHIFREGDDGAVNVVYGRGVDAGAGQGEGAGQLGHERSHAVPRGGDYEAEYA